MHRLMTIVGVGSLMAIVPTVPATKAMAAPNDPLGAVEYCHWKMTQEPTANLGECVSFVQMFFKSPNGMPPHQCDALMETDPALFDLLFESHADCVRTVRND